MQKAFCLSIFILCLLIILFGEYRIEASFLDQAIWVKDILIVPVILMALILLTRKVEMEIN